MELPSVPGVGQRARAGVRLMAHENPAELSKSALRHRNCENSCGDPGPTGVECMKQTTQQPDHDHPQNSKIFMVKMIDPNLVMTMSTIPDFFVVEIFEIR